MSAVRATDSSADSVAKASKRRASSATNRFPLDPEDTLNRFGLQWTTWLYASSIKPNNNVGLLYY